MNNITGNELHEPKEGMGSVVVSILLMIIAFILTLFTLLIFSRNYDSPNTVGIWVPIGITAAASLGGLMFGRNSLKTGAARGLSVFSTSVSAVLLLGELVLAVLLLVK
ncbi:hypothetical protein [Paenibacillus sp. J22TS3]|uniref:hypothetical protein n=1 Tax=Paenibacillus sp. J22TS3 TaxID=2807192 RepID=UPI001B14B18E|nr:hypothetical protein [Paenibacillus sp. J22TS3]GIP19999.1 hypothetical protein J22TS3_02740 [Paenibacillus sp. J22TS3]